VYGPVVSRTNAVMYSMEYITHGRRMIEVGRGKYVGGAERHYGSSRSTFLNLKIPHMYQAIHRNVV